MESSNIPFNTSNSYPFIAKLNIICISLEMNKSSQVASIFYLDGGSGSDASEESIKNPNSSTGLFLAGP